VENVSGLPHNVIAIGGRVVSIVGRLGAFTAHAATSPEQSADIGGFSANPDHTFDLVLDLSRSPHFQQSVPPLGYFAPGSDSGALARAIAAMPMLVGRLAKPRYFEYNAALCAHGAQKLTGCTRCIDVCSTAAIRSAGDVIAVDPYLCQGCATCTLACPTGALTFRQASREELLTRCEEAIADAQDAGVSHPVIVIHTAASAKTVRDGLLPVSAQAIEVTALPAFGEELWFAALARGAGGVVLVADACMPQDARAQLERSVSVARKLLAAIGSGQERIALATPKDVRAAITVAAAVIHGGARTYAPNPRANKRALLLVSLDSITIGRMLSAQPLPDESPWGEVLVDREKCTVCHACVNLCPTQALVADTEPRPRLSFIEANCVQCGLCEVGCPEKAIVLRSRFTPDPTVRASSRLLHEDDLARCTSCGTPFIGNKLLASSIARLNDFPGLTGLSTIERLKLCPGCRQRAVLDV
jgi:ferredoxin